MFVRKKPNKSGGKYEVLRTIGSSADPDTIVILYQEAQREINIITGQQQFNFDKDREKELIELFFHYIEGIELVGPELLLGKLFDEIGFNAIKDELFRHPVIKEEVIDVYKQLWNIEKAFRISKTDLRIRPVYHHLKRRIESHICIALLHAKFIKNSKGSLRKRNQTSVLKKQ